MKQITARKTLNLSFHQNAFILFEAITSRVGKTQTAEVVASVRDAANPQQKLGVEVLSCQITAPIQGTEANARRQFEVKATADWQIAADSDASMQDFTVTAGASSQGIGDLRSTVTFKYSQMK